MNICSEYMQAPPFRPWTLTISICTLEDQEELQKMLEHGIRETKMLALETFLNELLTHVKDVPRVR